MNTPWTIIADVPEHSIGYRAIVDADGCTICSPSPMGEANARLIAAAPDLLAALTHVLDRATMPGFLRDEVKSAITKATGA